MLSRDLILCASWLAARLEERKKGILCQIDALTCNLSAERGQARGDELGNQAWHERSPDVVPSRINRDANKP